MLRFRRATPLLLLWFATLFAPSARAVDLALQSGWTALSGAATPSAFLDRGVVHLRGAITGGSIPLAFNLPSEMRPETDVYVIVALCNAKQGRLLIQPNGNVQVHAQAGGFADAQCSTSLDGASFAPSASGFTTLALASGWTHAPFSTSSAAAALQDGIVRFKGAIAQGSATLLFTLPPELRPPTNVYVPVGLCDAKKGRLNILSTGEVHVQAAVSFNDANCFTSLDGAWFAPSPTGFSTLTLENGWTHAPFSTSNVAAVVAGGVVRFKGAMAQGSTAQAFTLPSALRPLSDVRLPIDLCVAREGRLVITTSGSVSIEAATGFGNAQCFTSLDGVSFLPSADSLTPRPLPFQDASFLLSDASPRTISLDLGTLPTRPLLVIEVTPPANRPDLQLQIEATNWALAGGYTFVCATPIFSPPGAGTARLTIELFRCASGPTNWASSEADIKIRVVDFGAGGAPATVSVAIRGETRPPTATFIQDVAPPFVTRTDTFVATKDAVVYEDLPTGGNGRGQFLWAGRLTTSVFNSYARNSLVAFDLESRIPPSAVVQSASLSLDVKGIVPAGGSLPLTVRRVAASVFDDTWREGFSDPATDEYFAEPNEIDGANWTVRQPGVAWNQSGGDPTGPVLVDTTIASTGVTSLSTPALTFAVQSMVASGSGSDGFVLMGSPPAPFAFVQQGIQFASRQYASLIGPPALPPTLVVDYYPTEVYEFGEIYTGTISYIDAAQNFRWIYDLQGDGVYETPIDGICEVTNSTPANPNLLPYRYRYQGDPNFVGVDCCTWRISSSTGVTGTGQALFFHHLDASDPANLPRDFDRDGIKDLCDNCVYFPNGPLRGTCLAGTVGANCRSNLECGTGGVCSLSQEDSDTDRTGDVCAPEPAFGAGLLGGVVGLIAVARRRRAA